MFDETIELRGKHATFIKQLVLRPNERVVDWKPFERYIDVYMVGALVGLLNERRVDEDSTDNDSARIFAETFARERAKCEFLFQLVMLLADANDSPHDRLDRAFRFDDASPDRLSTNMALFHAYVRGGIEVLHDRFANCTTEHECTTRMYEILTEMEHDHHGVTYEERIARLIKE